MSSQVLKIIAGVMLIGSLILAMVAWRLARVAPAPPAAAIPAAPPQHPVVVAGRTLHAAEIVSAWDLRLEPTTAPPPGAFARIEAVAGKLLAADVAAGQPILPKDLVSANPLAEALHEHERAVAMKVDEIIGVGGFIRPGDRVDVVAYLRADSQRLKESRAIVVLPAVRVLAYGEDTAPPPAESGGADKAKPRKGTGTAIVALDQADVTRLMAAENAGALRLALHPPGPGADRSSQPYPITLGDLAGPAASEPEPAKAKGPAVEIYRGSQLQQIRFP